MLNFSGLYSNKPIKCSEKSDWTEHENTIFYNKNGDFYIDTNELGKEISENGCIRFSSEKIKDVELWMSGVKAVFSTLKNWTHD